jgi:hypothetical protein
MPDTARPSGPTLSWVSHPMKRRPLVAVLVTLFIIICGLIIQATTETSWFSGLAMVVLFASLAKFYFPTRYRLDDTGVTVKTTTQTLTKEWRLYRSCYRDKNGLLLSPFAEPSRLENFRGLYLIFDGNGDDVTAFVKQHLPGDSVPGELTDTTP